MKIIGITGKSGSGKSTFASLLANKLKCKHIDIDKIGHEATFRPEIFDILIEKFGTEILNQDGAIDRKKLGAIVFNQKDKMAELTDLTWDFMQQQLDLLLSSNDEIILLDWMLLPDSKYWSKCDCKILITSDISKRKNIVVQRDNITEEYFEQRDLSSLDYSNFEFDYTFENDYITQTMEQMIEKICKQLNGGDK